MRFGGVLTTALMMAVLGASGARAELNINGPAEVPPPSFKGRQYVDSAGCVFVRGGFAGNVNWIPRVGRDKKQLCGYKPTFQNGEKVLEVAKAGPVAPAPAAAPAQVARVAPKAAPAPMPAPTPARTAATRPVSPFAPTPGVGKPMATIALTETPPQIGRMAPVAPAAPVAVAAAAPAVVVPAPAPVAPAAPVKTAAALSRADYVSPYALAGAAVPRYHNTVALPAAPQAALGPVTILAAEAVPVGVTSCPPETPVATRYQLSDGRRVVRCGAPAEDPAAFINQAAVPGLTVAAAAPAMTRSGYVSPYAVSGYSGAPLVGGTGYGASATNYAGANTGAPLVGGTGYSVTMSSQNAPKEVYVRPRAGAPVTLAPVVVSTEVGPTGYRPAFQDGRLNPYRGPRTAAGDAQQAQYWSNTVPSKWVPPGAAPVPVYYVPQPVLQARVSSKSPNAAALVAPARPALAQPQAAAGGRFVQVGIFGVAQNAEAAKARLRAAGLPVASSTLRKGGKLLSVVLSGPFADAGQALGAVRAAGFGDAILH
ncbi:MAG: SPOR domain-containing protein [Paenirhodobacter sp.]|uniref:SPOR domain-containing protein n=1 Tax=Paenirhodobacter sp. TaxID=1965326 RepID=UPI003D0FA728